MVARAWFRVPFPVRAELYRIGRTTRGECDGCGRAGWVVNTRRPPGSDLQPDDDGNLKLCSLCSRTDIGRYFLYRHRSGDAPDAEAIAEVAWWLADRMIYAVVGLGIALTLIR